MTPPLPGNIRTKEFLLEHISSSLKFFDPSKCIDPEGGFFHFYNEDGSIYDKHIRVMVTEARFVFTFAEAYLQLGNPEYLAAVRHGVAYLRGPLKNTKNGAYHWVLENGVPTDGKILTYGLAFALLAYSKALRAGVEEAREYVEETWNTLEEHMWKAGQAGLGGLYADEADENWVVDPYRSESGNLHMTEALIAAYEATKDNKFLERAYLVADNCCNRQAGMCQGLVWEHYNEDWTPQWEFNNGEEALTIFRPWGFQPGHQVEWARLLLTINRYKANIWCVPKAQYLFDVAVKQAWDPVHGGLAYSFDPDGAPCDWDKIFWVQCESIGTAAMLVTVTGDEQYWAHYERLWAYSWKVFVDHQYGSWRRRLNREGVPHFTEKTKVALCVDPDYHILGGLGGALDTMAAATVGELHAPRREKASRCC